MVKIQDYPESVTIIGAGNVAWHIAHALFNAHFKIDLIINQTIEKAEELAKEVNARFSKDFQLSADKRQYVIIAVSDTSLPEIIEKLKPENHILVHTSGSIGMDIFKDRAKCYGVLYPFQTLTKNVRIDFTNVSVFTEASEENTHKAIDHLASIISSHVYSMDSEHRRKLHLAGIMANNFTNHLSALAFDYLEKNGIDKKHLIPLLKETIGKMEKVGPFAAQTGPARRNNMQVIDMHLSLLNEESRLKNLYKAISDSIIAYYYK